MNNPFLLIIDGSSLLSTQFFGNLPREILFAKTTEEKEKYFHKIMKSSKGVYTNAVYGFLKVLSKILKEQRPSHLAVTWDISRDTFRREMYPPYKGNRSETLLPLAEQFELCERLLQEMGVPVFMSETYEADDYSGTLARLFEQEIPVKIMTKDHDYLQLVNERTHLWLMQTVKEKADELVKKYGLADGVTLPEKVYEFGPETVLSEFLVKPECVPSLKGLQGDSSDNIPGVKGVGPDTAVKLIGHYGTVAALYDDIRELTPEKEKALKQRWKDELSITRSPLSFLLKEGDAAVTSENGGIGLSGEASAFLSEKLAEIKTDIPLSVSLKDLETHVDCAVANRILRDLDITSFSFGFSEENETPKASLSVTEYTDPFSLEPVLLSLSKEPALGLTYEPGRALTIASPGLRITVLREALFMTHEVLSNVVRTLSAGNATLYVLDAKQFYKEFGVCLHDVSIAAYLLNPLVNTYDYNYLSSNFCRNVSFKNPESDSKEQAAVLLLAGEDAKKQLQALGMDKLYREIELPTAISLAKMEQAGILVEREALRRFSETLQTEIERLQAEIYSLSGEPFNLNSPKQLAELLFTKLAIPYPKKSKTYSTNADILDKLKGDYPIVAKILEYRSYQKLRSTYAEGLRAFISEDGRIYGTFHQTVTATGRISSANPNLQNIPVRLKLGREIRKLFVPEKGNVFIDADYSQIELRIMAHISGDRNLIDAYNHSADIHALTASKVFHVPEEDVTPEQRSRAKAVNFGIIYGISAFSLSEDLGVPRAEAEDYIKRYFEAFPGVKRYLDETVEKAREDGLVRTLYGRIRPIPELSARTFQERSFGERVAMNSPIQGTAADIMKIAVNRVNESLSSHGLSTKIVLQVHDEIILEAPENEADEAERLLVSEMQHAAALKVKLEVEAKRGYSWYETK